MYNVPSEAVEKTHPTTLQKRNDENRDDEFVSGTVSQTSSRPTAELSLTATTNHVIAIPTDAGRADTRMCVVIATMFTPILPTGQRRVRDRHSAVTETASDGCRDLRLSELRIKKCGPSGQRDRRVF